MYNAPDQTGYNKEIQIVARLARIEFWATEPDSPCKNKPKRIIKIVKGKSNRRIVQKNITKKVWDFGMVWEA